MPKRVIFLIIVSGIIFGLSPLALASARDPFVSIIDLEKQELAQQKVIDLSNVTVNGIIWNESKAIAIINDKLVMAGDVWRDFVVTRIEKDSVILRSQDKEYSLSLESKLVPKKEEAPERILAPANAGAIPEFDASNIGGE